MNKKVLTILWVVIIFGSAYIAINISKPNPKLEEDIEKLTDVDISENEKINEIEGSKKNTKTFKEYALTGDNFFAAEDYENAIINYQKALKINAHSSETLNKLGESFLRNNQPAEAEKNFTLASQLNPDSINLKINIARAHLNAREIQEAKDIIWKLEATNPLVNYYQGIIQILYKNFDESEKIFKNIVKTEPKPDQNIIDRSQKFIDAYQNFSLYPDAEQLFLQLLLAKAMTDTGEYQASIPLLFDILNKKNNYRDAWIVLGFAYLNTNKAQDAIDAFEQAKELTPDKPETLFFLGLAYFANNDIEKAIHFIESADEFGYEPKDQINLKLGDLYLLKKLYKKSAQKYENVISLNPQKIEVFTRAVWLNIDKLDNPEKALSIANKSLEYHKDKAMSYNLVGWAYTSMEEFTKAKENLETALAMDPKLDAIYLNLGWLYEKQENAKLAQEYYKKAYRLGKGNSISNLAAVRFNGLKELESQENYKIDVSTP